MLWKYTWCPKPSGKPSIQTFVSHFSSFIRLVDYLVINTFHQMLVKAVAQILAVLQQHISQTPSHAIIQNWNQQPNDTSNTADKKVCKTVGNCFIDLNSRTTVSTTCTRNESSFRNSGQFWLVFVFTSPSSQKLLAVSRCSSLSWRWTQMLWPMNPPRTTFRSVLHLLSYCICCFIICIFNLFTI